MSSNETADWIHPAGLVAKDEEEEKLRLICDLRELNKAFTTDCSVISTPIEVMQTLKASSKYYIKVDLIQCCHQMKLTLRANTFLLCTLRWSVPLLLECDRFFWDLILL